MGPDEIRHRLVESIRHQRELLNHVYKNIEEFSDEHPLENMLEVFRDDQSNLLLKIIQRFICNERIDCSNAIGPEGIAAFYLGRSSFLGGNSQN